MVLKTKHARINIELADLIKKIADANHIKYTEASREVARLIKLHRGKKITREIKF